MSDQLTDDLIEAAKTAAIETIHAVLVDNGLPLPKGLLERGLDAGIEAALRSLRTKVHVVGEGDVSLKVTVEE